MGIWWKTDKGITITSNLGWGEGGDNLGWGEGGDTKVKNLAFALQKEPFYQNGFLLLIVLT